MSRQKGNLAEDTACGFLYDNGFTIIERNFYSRFGEIDIIATKDEVFHFIEVKSGKATLSKKQRRVRDAVQDKKVIYEVF